MQGDPGEKCLGNSAITFSWSFTAQGTMLKALESCCKEPIQLNFVVNWHFLNLLEYKLSFPFFFLCENYYPSALMSYKKGLGSAALAKSCLLMATLDTVAGHGRKTRNKLYDIS